MRIGGFDWDAGNRLKCNEHGVSPAAIEEFFQGQIAVIPDPPHSKTEERFKAIGKNRNGRGIFVVFTMRRRGRIELIRPISARYMHRKELEHYEKEIASLQK